MRVPLEPPAAPWSSGQGYEALDPPARRRRDLVAAVRICPGLLLHFRPSIFRVSNRLPCFLFFLAALLFMNLYGHLAEKASASRAARGWNSTRLLTARATYHSAETLITRG